MKNGKEVNEGEYLLRIPSNSTKKSDIHLKLKIIKNTISHLLIITENKSCFVKVDNQLESEILINQVGFASLV